MLPLNHANSAMVNLDISNDTSDISSRHKIQEAYNEIYGQIESYDYELDKIENTLEDIEKKNDILEDELDKISRNSKKSKKQITHNTDNIQKLQIQIEEIRQNMTKIFKRIKEVNTNLKEQDDTLEKNLQANAQDIDSFQKEIISLVNDSMNKSLTPILELLESMEKRIGVIEQK